MKHRMVLVALTLALVLASFTPATAQTSITFGGWSSFVVDNGDRASEEPILYLSVDQAFAHGLSLGVWGSAGENKGREADIAAGWKGKNTALKVFYIRHAGGSTANLVQVDMRGFVAVGKDAELFFMLSPILPTNSTGDAGTLLRVGFATNGKLTSGKFFHGGWLMYDTGIFKGEQGFSLRYEVGLPTKKGKVTVMPAVKFSLPLLHMEKREPRIVGGIHFIM
ncbi:MAG: hypothetical protein WAV15_01100 [Minisyncoccia bacterium]